MSNGDPVPLASNLVTGLREARAALERTGITQFDNTLDSGSLYLKAADEIERLTRGNEILRDEIVKIDALHDSVEAERDRLLARCADETPPAPASNGISLLDEALQFVADGHKGHSLVRQLANKIKRLTHDATRFCAEATAAKNEVTRLTVERDQLLTAIGEHVTVRSDQYALIQRLRSERDSARDALRISEQRVREHWPERDRLRHERNAAHRKADRLLTALKSIRDLRYSAFRTYRQDTEDMRAIASRALALPSEPNSAPETSKKSADE